MEYQDSLTPAGKITRGSRCGEILSHRYRVSHLLGQGGMGDVYRGEQIQLGKPVAIKFLRDLFLSNDKSRARFVREAKAMGKLSHPHCVSIIDYGIDDRPFIVMDYVSGRPLDVIIRQEDIPCSRAVRIVLQVLAGLAHAHEQGIIHRDIKPENIVIQQAAGTGEHARILDFSLAKMADWGAISLNGEIMGTPAFMSPEQAMGDGVDARTDLYSVGLVLFELLTGLNPFERDDITETLNSHVETPAPRLGDVVPSDSFSVEIEAVVEKALAKAKGERFQNAVEFIEALSAVPEAGDLSDVWGSKKALQLLSHSAETLTGAPAAADLSPSEKTGETALSSQTGNGAVASRAGVLRAFPLRAAFVVFILAIGWKSSTGEIVETLGKTTSHHADRPQVDENNLIAQAKKLIASGQTDLAIQSLQKMRVSSPQSHEPPYLLANLYAEKEWWSAAISRYEIALELNPNYKKDYLLNQNVVRALANDRAFERAHAIIAKKIGKDAISHLVRTAANTRSVRLRRRAAKVLTELAEKKH